MARASVGSSARRAVGAAVQGAARAARKATSRTAADSPTSTQATAKKAVPAKKAAPVKKAATTKAAPAKKAATTKAAPAKKAATTKAAPAKKAAPTPSGRPSTARGRMIAPVKRSTAQPPTSSRGTSPTSLVVREDESPWTDAELEQVRAELQSDVERLESEISDAESDLQVLLRDAGDGAGDDQADAGAKTFEREQEITLANNSREMLEQSQRALARIADGTYGICESCGHPIGKMRLQAFPRATLCVTCKQKQERR